MEPRDDVNFIEIVFGSAFSFEALRSEWSQYLFSHKDSFSIGWIFVFIFVEASSYRFNLLLALKVQRNRYG